jgi:signal transduction histidine kinase
MIKSARIILVLMLLVQFCFSQNRETDSLKKVYLQSPTDTVKLQALSDLNWAYLLEDAVQAKNYAFKELSLAKKIQHKQFIAQAYNDIGLAYLRLGLQDSALAVFNVSLDLRKNLNSKALVASSLSKISAIEQIRGNYNEALKLEFEALRFYGELKNTNNEAMTLNNISSAYEKLNDPSKAIKYAEMALQIHLTNNNENELGSAYFNIGNCSMELFDFVKAKASFNKALFYSDKVGNKQNMAYCYSGLAVLEKHSNDFAKSLEFLYKAYDISISENNKTDIESFREQIIWVLMDLKKYDDAKLLAIKNLRSLDFTLKPRLLINYKQLAEIYALTNKGDSSRIYLEKFSALNDSIYSENNSIQIANAEKKYETEKKETEKKILIQQNNIATVENENNKKTIFILIILILLAFLVLLWQVSLTSIKKQKRALETEKKIQHDRERISRDLHDNVGGQLSYVLFSLEANEEESAEKRKKKADDLAIVLRGITGNLRETIWALNQEALTLKNISDKLKIYSRTIFLHSDTKIKFDETIEFDEALDSGQALNLFRICQEIINNVFKHAKATELKISINKSSKINITITDNGVGFDKVMLPGDNFGLSNIQKRANEINAQLIISTVLDKGTIIRVIV